MTNVSLVSPSVTIDRRSESYWRVVLSNPPINILDGAMLKGLQSVVDRLESDDRVKVVVFESADPDYFVSHFELAPGTAYDLTPGPTGLSPWMDFGKRLERGSFITVGKIRGRAAASEASSLRRWTSGSRVGSAPSFARLKSAWR